MPARNRNDRLGHMIPQAYQAAMSPMLDLVRRARSDGLYTYGRPFESGQSGRTRLGNDDILILSNSNYLGLAEHPDVISAMKAALDRYGSGSCGSRLANGTTPIHEELEGRLADWLGTEATLTYSSGYMANLGVISAMCDADTVIINDQLNHVSIMDGSRLTGGQLKIFAHNSVDKLEYVLRRNMDAVKRFVVVDGVYSMDGDLAPLPDIARLAREHDALLMVDEAHAIGVMGEDGRGATEHFGVRADLLTGTFSKSFGTVGGFVAASGDVVEYLRHASRTYSFNASPSAATVAGALKALELIQGEPWRREKLWENTELFRTGLVQRGFDVMDTATPIVPVGIGDEMAALGIAKDLFDQGIFIFTAMYPAVPLGRSRLRATITAAMDPQDLDHALKALSEVARDHGLFDPGRRT